MAIAVFVLLTCGLAVRWAPRNQQPSAGGFASRIQPVQSAQTKAKLDDRLLIAAPTAQGRSEFDDFMDLLTQSEKQPVAVKFAEEFLKEPALRQRFDNLKRGRRAAEPHGDLEALTRDITARPEFKRLLARFDQEAGFRQMVEPFMRLPQIRNAVHEQLRALQSANRSSARAALASATSRTGKTPAGMSGVRLGTKTETANASPSVSSQDGVSGSGDPARSGQGFAERGANAAPPTTQAEGGANVVSFATQAGDDGDEVDRTLAEVPGAGPDTDRSASMPGLCHRTGTSISPEGCAAIAGFMDSGSDFWVACYQAGIFDPCRVECAKHKVELDCGSAPSYYTAGCLAEGNAESDCEEPSISPPSEDSLTCPDTQCEARCNKPPAIDKCFGTADNKARCIDRCKDACPRIMCKS